MFHMIGLSNFLSAKSEQFEMDSHGYKICGAYPETSIGWYQHFTVDKIDSGKFRTSI